MSHPRSSDYFSSSTLFVPFKVCIQNAFTLIWTISWRAYPNNKQRNRGPVSRAFASEKMGNRKYVSRDLNKKTGKFLPDCQTGETCVKLPDYPQTPASQNETATFRIIDACGQPAKTENGHPLRG
jgi:hypothetical protein